MQDSQNATVDALMLMGFNRKNKTFFTQVEDGVMAQRLYAYCRDVATFRSIDNPESTDTFIFSLQFTEACLPRVLEWRGAGGMLHIPEDVQLEGAGIDLLISLNGSESPVEGVESSEVQTPPLDNESAQRLREALSAYDLSVSGGVGIEHLKIEGDLGQFEHRI